jgi:hypothetical protein
LKNNQPFRFFFFGNSCDVGAEDGLLLNATLESLLTGPEIAIWGKTFRNDVRVLKIKTGGTPNE